MYRHMQRCTDIWMDVWAYGQMCGHTDMPKNQPYIYLTRHIHAPMTTPKCKRL